MECLKNYNDNLTLVDENQYDFFDLYDLNEYLFGAPLKDKKSLRKIDNEASLLKENNENNTKFLADSNNQTSGIKLRLATDSSKVILKAELKRKYAHERLTLSCSSGFDFYEEINNGTMQHKSVVAPLESHNIFAELVEVTPKKTFEIYFPLYNAVENFSIGIKKGCSLLKAKKHAPVPPIVFYGNSCTQGASASRSGNAFVNIIGRKLNCEIINFSFSAACKAELSVASQIAQYDMSAFVMDYSRNAANIQQFKERYEPFYDAIRTSHKSIPFILIGALSQPLYDNHIVSVFKKLQKKGHPTFYINLNDLFSDIDSVAISVDSFHYTDPGMFQVADKIIEYLKQGSHQFSE